MGARKFKGIVLVAVMVAAASSLAREASPTEWPLERILANLETRLKESPDDAQTLYNLGRAHAFAFALKRLSLWVYNGAQLHVADLDRQDRKPPPSKADEPALQAPVPNAAELLEHLEQGVRNLRRACEREPKDDRFHLTFAWLLETGAESAARVNTPAALGLRADDVSSETSAVLQSWISDVGSIDEATAEAARARLLLPENLEHAVPLLSPETNSAEPKRRKAAADLLQRYWIERAIQEYAQALDLSSGDAAGLGPRNEYELHHMVAYEALEGYRRLVLKRGVQGTDEARRLAELDEKQKVLDALTIGGWVTPIVVSLDGCRTLDELVTPHLTVPFDLDGDGIDELWPWIAQDAGWLVWDPHHRGEITSGQQLFGTASAWLFFADGYRVLDALDDERNGKLEGPELDGISVWFDRNTNGVSDHGEVVPVAELGIVALATQGTLTIGASPANLCGAELADGRVLPTYDWVLTSKAVP